MMWIRFFLLLAAPSAAFAQRQALPVEMTYSANMETMNTSNPADYRKFVERYRSYDYCVANFYDDLVAINQDPDIQAGMREVLRHARTGHPEYAGARIVGEFIQVRMHRASQSCIYRRARTLKVQFLDARGRPAGWRLLGMLKGRYTYRRGETQRVRPEMFLEGGGIDREQVLRGLLTDLAGMGYDEVDARVRAMNGRSGPAGARAGSAAGSVQGSYSRGSIQDSATRSGGAR